MKEGFFKQLQMLRRRLGSYQKHPPELLHKKRCTLKFRNIHGKTPVHMSLFLIKLQESLVQVFSCELCEIYQNTFFTEHLRRLLLSYNFISAHFMTINNLHPSRPVDTGHKLNVNKTRTLSESLMYVQFTSCVYWDLNTKMWLMCPLVDYFLLLDDLFILRGWGK